MELTSQQQSDLIALNAAVKVYNSDAGPGPIRVQVIACEPGGAILADASGGTQAIAIGQGVTLARVRRQFDG